MSMLERKWWYVLLVSLLSALCTMSLMKSAGMPPIGEYGVAQWIVYSLCAGALWRGFSFTGWLVVVLVAPSLECTRTAARRS